MTKGASPATAVDRVTAADVQAALSPIDDIRATTEYRRAAAVELVRPLFFGQFDAKAVPHLIVLGVDLLLAWWLARTLTQRRFRA